MTEDLAARTAEMFEQRRATVRRFAAAAAACRSAALAGMTETDVSYRLLAAEFEAAREQVEAWEAFTPNHGDW
jgi:hypothetical protein